jgi:hypothetical protein
MSPRTIENREDHILDLNEAINYQVRRPLATLSLIYSMNAG